MKKSGFLSVLILLLVPICGLAREAENETLDDYVAHLNAECPISSGDNWVLRSFETRGDTVIVDLKVPSALSPFMSLLTSDSENVRRLWVREMGVFGETWKAITARLVEAERPLKLIFKLDRSEPENEIILLPTDFKQEE